MANPRSKTGKRWYDKYLPFVARSPEMKITWLVSHLKRARQKASGGSRNFLSCEEIRPYIKLLLEEDDSGMDSGKDYFFSRPQRGEDGLAELFKGLDEKVLELMLQAADIYDVPKLFGLIPQPTEEQALIALRKVPPPYEKKPFQVRDRVFQSIHAYSEKLLTDTVNRIKQSGSVPEQFEEAYERFEEIIKDEQLLSALYPKATIGESPK